MNDGNLTTNDWPLYDEQAACTSTDTPSVWYS